MKKVEIEDIYKYKFLSSPKISPNGLNKAFVVSNADKESNGYKSYIYILRDEKPYKLTSFGKESSFFFKDDNTIIFSGNREENKDKEEYETKFYEISLLGGEAELSFTLPFVCMSLVNLKDNKYLAYGSFNIKYPDLYKASKEEKENILKEIKKNEDYHEIEQIPFVFNGQGYIENMRSGLFIVDIDKKEYKRITPYNFEVVDFDVNENKNDILFCALTDEHYLNYGHSTLFHLDLSKEEYESIEIPKGFTLTEARYSGDDVFMYLAEDKRMGENSNGNFFLMDKSFNIKQIKEYNLSLGGLVLTDIEYGGGNTTKVDNGYFYFNTTEGEKTNLYRIDKRGNLELVYEPKNGGVCFFDVKNSELLMVNIEGDDLQELYSIDSKLTSFNDEAIKDCYIAKREQISFLNENNDEIHGCILKPIDFNENNKYPVILDVHGGPKCAYHDCFFHEMQVWASLGYFVIWCNPTGSDGRGDDFANITGKYGTVDFNDIMKFVDICLEKWPQMDKNNLFETGGSYGGFMSNWIIGHTDRFKAVASQRSISNWSIMYGVTDIGATFTYDQNLADPFNNPEAMWWHSPLKYAKNVKTPTLFIHSDQDFRCPLQEGLSMFTALIQNGVESRIVVFKGENHELSRTGKPEHRIKRLTEITNWFEKHRS